MSMNEYKAVHLTRGIHHYRDMSNVLEQEKTARLP